MSHHNNRPNPLNRYAALGLYNPKNCFNVGASLRAAGCFGAKMVVATGDRFMKKGDFRHMDTDDIHKKIPFIHSVPDLKPYIPEGCVSVAIELSEKATSLFDYDHPDHAFYIFGPEDGSLPEEVSSWCRDRVYVPMDFCANLAATSYIVLYDRMMKMSKKTIHTPYCPLCGSTHYVEDGSNAFDGTGEPYYKCQACDHSCIRAMWEDDAVAWPK